MTRCDIIGYVASGLVLGAFSMKSMIQLRIVAICSNLAFIAYGVALDLIPIVALHVVLLPMNGWRLWQVLNMRSDLSGSSICPVYTIRLPIGFAGSAIKLVAIIGSLVITTSVVGWLLATEAESSTWIRSFDMKRPNSPSVPTLIPLW